MKTDEVMLKVNSLETHALYDDEGGGITVVSLAAVRRLAHEIGDSEVGYTPYPEKGCHGPAAFSFQGFSIGADMMAGIKRYLCEFIMPGSFLMAIICNDLKQAVGRADGENLRNLPAFAAFFYNHAPLVAHGGISDVNEYTKAVIKFNGEFRQECLSFRDAEQWLEIQLEQNARDFNDEPATLKTALATGWSIRMKYQDIADAVRQDWKW